MTQKIRVVLAEDQSMLRGALAALLSIEPDIEVLGLTEGTVRNYLSEAISKLNASTGLSAGFLRTG